MERAELELMSIDDLWALHEAVSSMLAEKLAAKKKIVEQRLAELKPIIRPSVQRRRHRLLPTAVGRENRVVKTPGADLTPIEPAIVRPAAGPGQEPAIADAVNSELGWQRFHLRNIGPAGGVCTQGRLSALDLDQGRQNIAAMTNTDDPDLDLDELTPKQPSAYASSTSGCASRATCATQEASGSRLAARLNYSRVMTGTTDRVAVGPWEAAAFIALTIGMVMIAVAVAMWMA